MAVAHPTRRPEIQPNEGGDQPTNQPQQWRKGRKKHTCTLLCVCIHLSGQYEDQVATLTKEVAALKTQVGHIFHLTHPSIPGTFLMCVRHGCVQTLLPFHDALTNQQQLAKLAEVSARARPTMTVCVCVCVWFSVWLGRGQALKTHGLTLDVMSLDEASLHHQKKDMQLYPHTGPYTHTHTQGTALAASSRSFRHVAPPPLARPLGSRHLARRESAADSPYPKTDSADAAKFTHDKATRVPPPHQATESCAGRRSSQEGFCWWCPRWWSCGRDDDDGGRWGAEVQDGP